MLRQHAHYVPSTEVAVSSRRQFEIIYYTNQKHFQEIIDQKSSENMDTEIIQETITKQSENEDITVCDVTDDESVGNSPISSRQYELTGCVHSKQKDKYSKAMGTINYIGVPEMINKRNTDGQVKETDMDDIERDESNIESKDQRTKINMRERKRMHDLNKAMESLREVMPCANGPSMRKLSKIATLTFARNYIQMLTRSIEDLKLMLDDVYRTQGGGPMVRRRPAVTVQPYGPYLGISNNFNSYYPAGFEQCANIYSNSNSIAVGPCVGLRCCNPGPTTMQTRLQRNVCTPWNSHT